MAPRDAQSGGTKQILLLAVLVIAVAVAIAGYVVKDRKAPKKIIATGDRAPEFRLPSTDGRSVGLSDTRGKIVMVHFWATWCPPCVEELPTLAQLNRELPGSDFEMLAVSVDEGGQTAVKDFMRKNGIELPVLMDPGGSVASSYGTYKLPETYILDRQGVVRYKIIGPRDWRDPDAPRVLRGLIAER
jgi:peroxiredoxin